MKEKGQIDKRIEKTEKQKKGLKKTK